MRCYHAALLVKQLLSLFPNTPTLTLAKKAYALHPEMWTDLESTRSMFRFYRGASGRGSRKHTKASRDFSKQLFNPFDFPASDEAEYLPYILPEDCKKILWLSDVHIPYHSLEALTDAVQVGIMEQVDTIFLAGDFMGTYFEKFEDLNGDLFQTCSHWKRLETGGITKRSHGLSFLQI